LEALYLFRNASHAYKILGKDTKTRAEYDAKYRTIEYLNVLEEVSNDVLRPLAMGVAIPLLNLTVKTIGSFAIPFLRDAMEQGNVVFKAAMDSYDTPQSSQIAPQPDFIARTATAIKNKKYEQNIRKTNESLVKSELAIVSIRREMLETIVSERELSAAVEQQEIDEKVLLSSISVYERFVLWFIINSILLLSLHIYFCIVGRKMFFENALMRQNRFYSLVNTIISLN
jgi:hypothetical protein